MRDRQKKVSGGVGVIVEYLHRLATHNHRESARLYRAIDWLNWLTGYIAREDEDSMRIANIIEKLEGNLAAQKARADRLQAQIDAQAPNIPDAADLAAMDRAEAEIAAGDGGGGTAPGDTTGGAGGAGGAGDTTGGAAAGAGQ